MMHMLTGNDAATLTLDDAQHPAATGWSRGLEVTGGGDRRAAAGEGG